MSKSATIDRTCGHDICTHKGTYTLPGRCMNCGWRGLLRLTKTHEFPSRSRCPDCECNSVRQEWDAA